MVGMELFCGTADNSPFGTPIVLRMLIGRDERIFALVSDEIKGNRRMKSESLSVCNDCAGVEQRSFLTVSIEVRYSYAAVAGESILRKHAVRRLGLKII